MRTQYICLLASRFDHVSNACKACMWKTIWLLVSLKLHPGGNCITIILYFRNLILYFIVLCENCLGLIMDVAANTSFLHIHIYLWKLEIKHHGKRSEGVCLLPLHLLPMCRRPAPQVRDIFRICRVGRWYISPLAFFHNSEQCSPQILYAICPGRPTTSWSLRTGSAVFVEVINEDHPQE